MTNDSSADKQICRIQLTDESRWISLALSLGDLPPNNRFVVSSENFLYAMESCDDLAKEYGLSNWQGGVISGARYAFRAL